MSFLNFEVTGAEEIIAEFEAAGRDVYTLMENVASIMKPFIRDQVIEIFRNAAALGGEGFPPIYIDQLLRTVARMPIIVTGSDFGVDIEMDLEELGTYEEFEETFHYHASLGDGDWVEFPYEGEELKNSYDQRLQFWESVATGTHIPGQRYTEGMYQDTLEARVKYWNSIGKSPQWLLLNYGQTETYPPVYPQPIVEEIASLEYGALGTIMEQELKKMSARRFGEKFVPAPPQYHYFESRPGYQYIRGAGGRFAGSRKV